MNDVEKFSSIEAVREYLIQNRYISDQSLATVIYLAYHLKKPIFLEGEPGVRSARYAGDKASDACIRICFAQDPKRLTEGLDRLGKAVAAL